MLTETGSSEAMTDDDDDDVSFFADLSDTSLIEPVHTDDTPTKNVCRSQKFPAKGGVEFNFPKSKRCSTPCSVTVHTAPHPPSPHLAY